MLLVTAGPPTLIAAASAGLVPFSASGSLPAVLAYSAGASWRGASRAPEGYE